MSKPTDSHADVELFVFREFATQCSLGINLTSIEKRYSPEPDIRCRLGDGSEVAFEMVNVDDQGSRHRLAKKIRVQQSLYSHYSNLNAVDRLTFDERFHGRGISVFTKKEATDRALEHAVSAVFQALLSMGKVPGYIRAIAGTPITKIIVWDSPARDREPLFSLGSGGFVGIPVEHRVGKKLDESVKYQSDAPIEILAWCDVIVDRSQWLSSYREMLAARLDTANVRRVWVYERAENATLDVFPPLC